MARNSEDRQETINGTGELVQQEGKWYKRVRGERAWSISKDIQVYIRHSGHSHIYRITPPHVYRAVSHSVPMSQTWKDPYYHWFVEIEQTAVAP